MDKIYLWDGETRQLTEILNQPELLERARIQYGEKLFYRYKTLSGFFISPPNEETLTSLLFGLWQNLESPFFDLPQLQEYTAVGQSWNIDRYDIGYQKRAGGTYANLERAKDLKSFIQYELQEDALSLKDGAVGYYSGYSPKIYLLEHLIKQIETMPSRPRRIVEIGCGAGLNMVYLKSQLPDIECYGIDPAPTGIQIAKDTAKKFGCDVLFQEGNLTSGLTDFPDNFFDVSWTHSVLVQLTTPVEDALNVMTRITGQNILLYEHFSEMLAATPLGWASLYYLTLRSRYATGLLKKIRASMNGRADTQDQYLLGHALNPLENPCFMNLKLRTNDGQLRT